MPKSRRASLSRPAATSKPPARAPQDAPTKIASSADWAFPAAALIVFVASLVAMSPILRNDFILFDDQQYVTQNPIVQRGVTAENLAYGLTSFQAYNWHPLTWWSHMLDCQLFALQAGGHHATSLLLHALTAVMLLWALRQLTGELVPSFLVALLFALHPLAVESVAWVAERKNVLSTLLGFAALGCYARYARQPSVARYLAFAALFWLSLMSKQMLVTFPALCLVLDYWPLRRAARAAEQGGTTLYAAWQRLVIEKLPLFGLSLIASALVLRAQGHTQASLESHPLWVRLGNAAVSLVVYLRKLFWPADLAVFYPHRGTQLPVAQILLCGLIVLAITALVVWQRTRRPYLLVGWLWYMGTLVPVLGLIQVGNQALADRYTYVPLVGVYLALAWWLCEWMQGRVALPRWSGWAVGALLIVVLAPLTYLQAQHWRNTRTLFEHTLAVTTENPIALHLVGEAQMAAGEYEPALAHLRQSVELAPEQARPRATLAELLLRMRRLDEAKREFEEALRINANLDHAWVGLGKIQYVARQPAQAEQSYRRALALNPRNGTAWGDLLLTLAAQNRQADAQQEIAQLVERDPMYAVGHFLRATQLTDKGRVLAARLEFERALELDDTLEDAARRLAWLLATSPEEQVRNAVDALRWSQRLHELSGGKNPFDWDVQAAALANAGRFSEAVQAAKRGMDLALAQGNQDLAASIASRGKQYVQNQPYREPPQPAP
jgi:tetratricopeptide (TPR) repeat protein